LISLLRRPLRQTFANDDSTFWSARAEGGCPYTSHPPLIIIAPRDHSGPPHHHTACHSAPQRAEWLIFTLCMHTYKMHTYKIHAHEVHAHEVHAHEMYAYKVRAPETHICKMHALEMHAHRYTPNEIYAHEICAYEMGDAGNFFIIKRSYTSPYIPCTADTLCSLDRNI
jgi:hypothetical protein